MQRRQQSIISYLLLRILPLVLIPIALAYWFIYYEITVREARNARSRHAGYAKFLSQSIDREIMAQATFLESLALKVSHETQNNNFGILSQALANQSHFSEIYVANLDGHILWANSEKMVDPQKLQFRATNDQGIIRFLEEGDAISFLHFVPIRHSQNNLNVVGKFGTKLLDELCRSLLETDPNVTVAFFPTVKKVRYIECQSQNTNKASNKTVENRKKKILNEIKNNLNDERFQEKVLQEFGIATPISLPARIGFIDQDLFKEEEFHINHYAFLVLCLIAFFSVKIVLNSAKNALNYDLLSVENSLRRMGEEKFERQEMTHFTDMERHLNAVAEILKTQEEQRIRARIMQKSFVELSTHTDGDQMMAHACKMIAFHSGAEKVIFIPEKSGHYADYADSRLFIGLNAWVCSDKVVSIIDQQNYITPNLGHQEFRSYEFVVSNRGGKLGTFYVHFAKTPDDFIHSVLHGMIFLIESVFVKHEVLKAEAQMNLELEIASKIQKSLPVSKVVNSLQIELAYFFQPTTRLGGDWLYLFESSDRRIFTFLIGDMSGQGLNQGLVATALKGSMDMLMSLMEEDIAFAAEMSPKKIIAHLEKSMKRVSDISDITMTCLCGQINLETQKLTICNAGHTFPILISGKTPSEKSSENKLTHLSKAQNHVLGYRESLEFNQSEYSLLENDYVFVYSDGLSHSKKLKKTVFQKILHRKLRTMNCEISPQTAVDEISSLFSYYSQGQFLEDDVCFMFIKVPKIMYKSKIMKAS